MRKLTKAHISAVEKLISLYNKINEEFFEYTNEYEFEHIFKKFTGFGAMNTCRLCQSVCGDCDKCIYNVFNGKDNEVTYACTDTDSIYLDTYDALEEALENGTVEQIIKATKQRKQGLIDLLKEYKKCQNIT